MTHPYLVSCTIPPEHGGGITVSHACLVAIDGESEEDAMANARVALRKSFPHTPDDLLEKTIRARMLRATEPIPEKPC